MKPAFHFFGAAISLLIGACSAPHDAQQVSSREPVSSAMKTGKAPEWVKKVHNRMAETLVEKQLCKNGPAWGLARRDPTGKLYGNLEYEEIGSAGYCHIVEEYHLWDKVPPLTEQE